jgi:hypothetical protein
MRIVFLLIASTVVACVPAQPPGLAAALQPVPVATSHTCASTEACALSWQRAQLWLANHAHTKLQTVTDVVLQTYGVGAAPRFNIQVTKTPDGRGGAAVKIGLTCGMSGLVSCTPGSPEIERAFYHYLSTGQDLLVGLMRVNDSVR